MTGPGRMSLNSEIASLHAGDRVLEVNGLPVSGNNMATIEKIINDAHEDVQVRAEEGRSRALGPVRRRWWEWRPVISCASDFGLSTTLPCLPRVSCLS